LRGKCRLFPSVVAECELLFQFGREGVRVFASFGASFIHRNPTIAMLVPGVLLYIGAALIAGGFGFHFRKSYI
jgi:predicted tellurium resistance membrane protein TerC